MKDKLDRIDNIILIENNLIHLDFELSRKNTSYFRVAREIHQVFYRTMVEALRGSANLSITGRSKNKKRYVKYKIGKSPFMEVNNIDIKGCKKAWRFSVPIHSKKSEELNIKSEIPPFDDYLKSFYDVLAMIQTECFMARYVMSKPIKITDDEMKKLEWLHEKIRNEYEHFIPKLYLAPILDLLEASLICIDKTENLIFKSGNIFQSDLPDTIISLLGKNMEKIQQTIEGLAQET